MKKLLYVQKLRIIHEYETPSEVTYIVSSEIIDATTRHELIKLNHFEETNR
jgi:hypothetical protein